MTTTILPADTRDARITIIARDFCRCAHPSDCGSCCDANGQPPRRRVERVMEIEYFDDGPDARQFDTILWHAANRACREIRRQMIGWSAFAVIERVTLGEVR